MQHESNAQRLVVAYQRVSTDKQDISRQKVQRERAAAVYPGLELKVLQDDGVSAYKVPIFDRRGGRQLCALVEEQRVEAIFVDAQDRLSRGRQSEWWNFADLCEQNRTRIFIDGRELRLDEEGDEIKSAIDAIIARRESREKGHRVRGGKRRAAEDGRRNGGPRPYGYAHVQRIIDGKTTSALEQVTVEVEFVRQMFKEYASGRSQADIARELNAAGARTTRGFAWSQARVGQILRNPLYRGMVRHGDDLFPGRHTAIVSAELWNQVEALRVAAARRDGNGGGRPPKGNHLLTNGVLRCSCGAAMRARTEPKGYGTWQAYLCDGRHSGRTRCTMPAISREKVDGAVWRYFETVGLDYETMVREGVQRRSLELSQLSGRIDEAERDAANVAERLARVEADYLEGKLSARRYEHLLDRLESEHAAAVAAVAQLRAREQEVREAAAVSDTESETRQQLQAIREMLAGVVSGAADLPAARRALRRVFEAFTIHRYECLPGDELLDADLAGGDWYLVPTVRADAVLAPLIIGEENGEPVVEQDQELLRGSLR